MMENNMTAELVEKINNVYGYTASAKEVKEALKKILERLEQNESQDKN